MNTAVRLCLASALAVSSTAQDPPALTQTVRELRAIRGADSVGSRTVCALPALCKGLMYDDDARDGTVNSRDPAIRIDGTDLVSSYEPGNDRVLRGDAVDKVRCSLRVASVVDCNKHNRDLQSQAR